MRDVRGGVRQCHLDDFDVLRPDVLLFFAERVRNLMVVCVNKRLAVGLCKKTHIQRLNLVIIGGVDAKVFGQASDCVSGTVGEVGRVQLVLLRQGPFEVLGARFFWDVRDFHLLHLFSNVPSSVLGFGSKRRTCGESRLFRGLRCKSWRTPSGRAWEGRGCETLLGLPSDRPRAECRRAPSLLLRRSRRFERRDGVVQGLIVFIEKLESGVEG